MERWFDLHLYFADWGTRRLMVRLPKRFVDLPDLGAFLDDVDVATVRSVGDNVILDIVTESEDRDDDAWMDDEPDDGAEWLAAIAPLRADVIAGDLRLFYLLWLWAVDVGILEDDRAEPLPGIGPLTEPLQAFADFFCLDPDLVQAAAEREGPNVALRSAGSMEATIAELADEEKTALLARLLHADPYVGTDLRRVLRSRLRPVESASHPALRTAGDLRARAEALRLDRDRIAAEAAAAQLRREADEVEKKRQGRLGALAARGEAVWDDIEVEIVRRNPSGYAKAAGLLSDMKALAVTRGIVADFDKRLAAIKERHANKGRFIERLAEDGL